MKRLIAYNFFRILACITPSISSALTVPSSQEIPMTRRGISSSFWVMTATKRNGSFFKDLKHVVQYSATMIILMGIRKIKEIVTEVSKYRELLSFKPEH